MNSMRFPLFATQTFETAVFSPGSASAEDMEAELQELEARFKLADQHLRHAAVSGAGQRRDPLPPPVRAAPR